MLAGLAESADGGSTSLSHVDSDDKDLDHALSLTLQNNCRIVLAARPL